MDVKEVKNFVFAGQLARHAVRDMEASGLLRERALDTQEKSDRDLLAAIEEEVRSGANAMQRAYKILYALENVVRHLIIERFKDSVGETWFDTKATVDMKRKRDSRIEKEEKNQWHTGRNRHPIYYLDFGDLAKLIVNSWDVFDDLLPSQPWVVSRLDDAERSRNVIAHTNLLSAEEINRLEMYLRDWIKQIG